MSSSDCILVSQHFDTGRAGFHHDWRTADDPLSDHSAAWAEVVLRS